METYVRVIQNINRSNKFHLALKRPRAFHYNERWHEESPLQLRFAPCTHLSQADYYINHPTTSDEIKNIWETKIVDSILPARESRRDALRKSNEFFEDIVKELCS